MGLTQTKTFDCYCPKCKKFVGAWWYLTAFASQPIFLDYPCTKGKDGYSYCGKCSLRWSWDSLIKYQR